MPLMFFITGAYVYCSELPAKRIEGIQEKSLAYRWFSGGKHHELAQNVV
jgi:hypothetical protein